MLVGFSDISDDSRIWIYASENKLTKAQHDYILDKIFSHLKVWEAHKKPLEAAATILENHFIIIALDESNTLASGCSIDTLQRIIQDLEKDLSISLMNRLNVYCNLEDKIECIPSFKLKEKVSFNTLFYDLTITHKSELADFVKPIKDGWCHNLIQ